MDGLLFILNFAQAHYSWLTYSDVEKTKYSDKQYDTVVLTFTIQCLWAFQGHIEDIHN